MVVTRAINGADRPLVLAPQTKNGPGDHPRPALDRVPRACDGASAAGALRRRSPRWRRTVRTPRSPDVSRMKATTSANTATAAIETMRDAARQPRLSAARPKGAERRRSGCVLPPTDAQHHPRWRRTTVRDDAASTIDVAPCPRRRGPPRERRDATRFSSPSCPRRRSFNSASAASTRAARPIGHHRRFKRTINPNARC